MNQAVKNPNPIDDLADIPPISAEYPNWQKRGYVDVRDVLYSLSWDKESYANNKREYVRDAYFRKEVQGFRDELNDNWLNNGEYPKSRLG